MGDTLWDEPRPPFDPFDAIYQFRRAPTGAWRWKVGRPAKDVSVLRRLTSVFRYLTL